MSRNDRAMALKRLINEYKTLSRDDSNLKIMVAGPVDEDDMFKWRITLAGPPDTVWDCGVFEAELKFPTDYPHQPPEMRFIDRPLHPNIYKDGRVCISILHPPGDDPNHYELASERWSPIQSVEKIILSVMSLLAEPNDESPANVKVAVLRREQKDKYESLCREQVQVILGLKEASDELLDALELS